MSTQQPDSKPSVNAGVMPVHQIVVSPITGLLETHTVTIREVDQVVFFPCFFISENPSTEK